MPFPAGASLRLGSFSLALRGSWNYMQIIQLAWRQHYQLIHGFSLLVPSKCVTKWLFISMGLNPQVSHLRQPAHLYCRSLCLSKSGQA